MNSGTGAAVPTTRYRTLADRLEEGRSARDRLAPADLGAVSPDTPDSSSRDPVALLLEQAGSRVPELVPVRHGRMARTPFTFYRGAALVMADDLSRTPHSGLTVQLCGDAHLSNFGFFATPERRLAFDVNDFDETYPGPFEWDVKRLAASLAVAALDNGFTRKDAKRVARACAREYRETMASQASLGTLAGWYSHSEPTEKLVELRALVDVSTMESLRKQIKKAWHRDSLQALSKLTTVVDGEVLFISAPPLIVPVEEILAGRDVAGIYDELRGRIDNFRATMAPHHRALLDKFEFVRMARKVVGVGSVGTQAWVLLFRGKDDADPLLLQAKEAQESVLARYLDGPAYQNQGQRVVEGQRLIQAAGDVFLGWDTGPGFDGVGRDFYLRQLRDGKGAVMIETLDVRALTVYGRVCGRVLAYGHSRSGDPVTITEYLRDTDEFDRAMGRFAVGYAERNIADHDAFVNAIERGVVTAVADY
ncbi:DUF2252 domain-containing protein [Gordonia sp. CPCC 206044]|uniref:DUF2252 domain-containing protein n=1 Tax=Gordonia sp. CPCC 206044 TaxID=3140793 RepID=UPI003AF37485